MKYPKQLHLIEEKLNRFSQLKAELGSKKIYDKMDEIHAYIEQQLKEIEAIDDGERFNEPSLYKEIKEQSKVNEIENKTLDIKEYTHKLKGALYGRFAGCALGAPVELLSIGELELFAKLTDHSFPPVTYWPKAPNGYFPRYKNGKGNDFTSEQMAFLSTDDDIAYTLMSLLVLEQYGFDYEVKDLADLWKKHLPIECTFTAERTTLQNLYDGIDPLQAGEIYNYDTEFIGAAIRCDGYGYVSPGNAVQASYLAYKDAYLSHRRSGIYSSMYFAALIALAFTSDDIVHSMYEALKVVPENTFFYQEVKWALDYKEHITNYKDANDIITKRYPGMSWVHAINNACLTVWGVYLGKDDFTKGISETVAMAYDNDCTGATVGSILGAYLGFESIEPHWYNQWNNKILSYLKGIESFEIDDVVSRYISLYRNKNEN